MERNIPAFYRPEGSCFRTGCLELTPPPTATAKVWTDLLWVLTLTTSPPLFSLIMRSRTQPPDEWFCQKVSLNIFLSQIPWIMWIEQEWKKPDSIEMPSNSLRTWAEIYGSDLNPFEGSNRVRQEFCSCCEKAQKTCHPLLIILFLQGILRKGKPAPKIWETIYITEHQSLLQQINRILFLFFPIKITTLCLNYKHFDIIYKFINQMSTFTKKLLIKSHW